MGLLILNPSSRTIQLIYKNIGVLLLVYLMIYEELIIYDKGSGIK